MDERDRRVGAPEGGAPLWGPPVVARRRRVPGWAAGFLAGGLAVAVLGGVFVLGRSGAGGAAAPDTAAAQAAPTTAPTTTPTAVAPTTTVSPTAVAPTTVAPAPTTAAPPAAAPATAPPGGAPSPAPAASAAPVAGPPPAVALPALASADASAPVVPRSALYAAGKVHLRGGVTDQALAEQIVAKVAAVVGRDHVVVEYLVDPRAPVAQSVPLTVADTVLFEPDRAQVAPDFGPLLDLGAALLRQNPQATLTVIGHTDSQGTPAQNLLLSKARVDAVVAELVARGVPVTQLLGVPRGDAEPVADNATPEGRRVNRRVEFRVAGLVEA